jgi:transposase
MTKLKERELMCADVLQENGISNREIARKLGVDESTIRYRSKHRQDRIVDGLNRQASVCDPYKKMIEKWMSDQSNVDRPESIRSLYEELVIHHDFMGSYKAVVRYVRRNAAKPKTRPIRRVETVPGAQGQVDWITHRLFIQEYGEEINLHAFIIVLSHSRMWSAIWSRRQDLLAWIDCHNRALEFLQGVPRYLRIDNLKTGVISGAGAWATLNQGYASYAKQVGFVIDPCRVRMASDKGKVERRGRDIKSAMIQSHEKFASLQALQQTTNERILNRATKLNCPVTGKSIYETWRQEQNHLQPLPQTLPLPFDVQVQREVGRDCLVSFEGRQYHTPFPYTGRIVEVRGGPDRVEIYSQNRLLATYPRGTDCRLLIDQNHYEGESTDRIMTPTPLGKIAQEIVMEKSWEVPNRPMNQYEAVVRRLSS